MFTLIYLYSVSFTGKPLNRTRSFYSVLLFPSLHVCIYKENSFITVSNILFLKYDLFMYSPIIHNKVKINLENSFFSVNYTLSAQL